MVNKPATRAIKRSIFSADISVLLHQSEKVAMAGVYMAMSATLLVTNVFYVELGHYQEAWDVATESLTFAQ